MTDAWEGKGSLSRGRQDICDAGREGILELGQICEGSCLKEVTVNGRLGGGREDIGIRV